MKVESQKLSLNVCLFDLLLRTRLMRVSVIQAGGGVMTLDDLKNHTTTPVTPISYSYGGPDGVTLHECPPNGQGITALIALGILDVLQEDGIVDMDKMEHNGTQWLHTLIEVMRIAFADVRAYVADPEMSHVPVEQLLSKVSFFAAFEFVTDSISCSLI